MNKKILIIGSIFLIVLVGIGLFALKSHNKEVVAVAATIEATPKPIEEADIDVEPVGEVEEVPEVKEEEVLELTEIEKLAQEFNLTLFDEENVLVRYTNTSSNIRKTPDKDGEKLTSLSINTEVSVLGITTPENKADEWSLIQLSIENTDTYCFIKSSLLSDTKTKISTPPKTQAQGNKSQGTTPQPQSPPQPSPPPSTTTTTDQQLKDAFGIGGNTNPTSDGIIF